MKFRRPHSILLLIILASSSYAQDRIRSGFPDPGSRSGILEKASGIISMLIQESGGLRGTLAIIGMAFAYGVLHALGPGHQKTMVTGTVLAGGGSLKRALGAAGLASLGHAVSVAGLGVLLWIAGFSLSAADLNRTGKVVTRLSGVILIVLTGILLFRRLADMVCIIWIKEKADGARADRNQCAHEGCSVCRHPPHGVLLSWSILISSLASPCPGAAFFLLLGFRSGNPVAGVIAVVSLSCGMALTLSVIACIAWRAQRSGSAWNLKHAKTPDGFIVPALRLTGAVLVFCLAVSMGFVL